MNAAAPQRRKERIDRGIKVRTEGIYALMSWRELAYLTVPRLVLIVGLLALPLVMPGMYWQRVDFHCLYLRPAGPELRLPRPLRGAGVPRRRLFRGYRQLSDRNPEHQTGALPSRRHTGCHPDRGALCTLMLLPCLPLRGVYFAIVTLMYPLFLARVIEALDILGGTDGIMGIDSFPSAWLEQYFVIIMLLLFLFAIRRLVNTDLGLVLRAVKDNDQAVRASGMDVTRYRALAVFIASAIGCLAGACLVHIYMWAGISTFALDFSVLPIAATVIGGSGTLVGPLLGCLILVPVSELLRDFGTLRIVFYSLILLAFIVFRSEGLMVYGQRKYHQIQRWTKI